MLLHNWLNSMEVWYLNPELKKRINGPFLLQYNPARCRCDKNAEERVHIEMYTIGIPPMDW